MRVTEPVALSEVGGLPLWVDPVTAGRLLGMSRSVVYGLLETREFPAHAYKVGREWRIPTAGVLDYLGLDPNAPIRGCGCGSRRDEQEEDPVEHT